jgi:hypothetical protein
MRSLCATTKLYPGKWSPYLALGASCWSSGIPVPIAAAALARTASCFAASRFSSSWSEYLTAASCSAPAFAPANAVEASAAAAFAASSGLCAWFSATRHWRSASAQAAAAAARLDSACAAMAAASWSAWACSASCRTYANKKCMPAYIWRLIECEL